MLIHIIYILPTGQVVILLMLIYTSCALMGHIAGYIIANALWELYGDKNMQVIQYFEKAIKKILGWPACQVLYYGGCFVHQIMNLHEKLGRLYPIYGYLMTKSVKVNDWAGLNLWKANKDNE